MKIVSSFLPPITHQLPLRSDQSKSENVREVFAELVDDNLSVPVTMVVTAEFLPQKTWLLQERIDLRLLLEDVSSSNELPLNNQRALASYQTVGDDLSVPADSIFRLDIIV